MGFIDRKAKVRKKNSKLFESCLKQTEVCFETLFSNINSVSIQPKPENGLEDIINEIIEANEFQCFYPLNWNYGPFLFNYVFEEWHNPNVLIINEL